MMKGSLALTVGCVLVLCVTALSCTTTQKGAVAGGALGAGVGAIIGHQSGHTTEGALIGGGAGALGGALVGDAADNSRQRQGQYPQQPQAATPAPSPGGHGEVRKTTDANGNIVEEQVWVRDK